jgi:hypothetical protein
MENDRTNQDLENLKSRLLVRRNEVGAETPLGWHLSNLIEQIRNYQKEPDQDARARLEKFMAASVAAIEVLNR